MKEDIILNSGLRYIDDLFLDTLKVAKTDRQEDEDMFIYSDKISNKVPTYISLCPHCEQPEKWRTSGVFPLFITCKKCGNNFKVW